MRRAAKVDGNHAAIRDHLRAVGWSVRSTATIGCDFPDLLVSRSPGKFTALVEVKVPGGRVKPGQVKFRKEWPGVVVTATSPREAELLLALEYEFAVGHPAEYGS